jgi:hypothetical protein
MMGDILLCVRTPNWTLPNAMNQYILLMQIEFIHFNCTLAKTNLQISDFQ